MRHTASLDKPEKAILLAHYLPQFHPVPENDEYWGKGFTEWTNTAAARPLYGGHCQPNLPADTGFYDLRLPEARALQADLARAHGITGFAYWHYWFGNGRRVLERPFDEVLATGRPDFPFCLAWANESWTGIWHGLKDKVLLEQAYPGEEDHTAHFRHLLPAFLDPRYIRIGNRPLFIVYLPHLLPDAGHFTRLWNRLALENGLEGIFFLGIHNIYWDHRADGFDEKSVHPLPHYVSMYEKNPVRRWMNRIGNLLVRRNLEAYPYRDLIGRYRYELHNAKDFIPSVLPNWDNTPRSGRNGVVVHGSTPDLFRSHFEKLMQEVVSGPSNPNRIVLLKSWNEWAEGNYLEPDIRWGAAYLEAIRGTLEKLNIDTAYRGS